MANRQGYVRRSRLVLAQELGRPLTPEEICHHINRDPKDDRPGNLKLFRNHSAHTKHHRSMHFIERERHRLVLDLLERIHLEDRN